MNKIKQVRSLCLFLFLFLFIGTGFDICQQQTQPPALTIQNIKGNIYLVKGGSGANTGFYISDKDVLVIDAKMTADSTKQIVEEIKKLSSNPITQAIITHSDGDHVNGLDGFPRGMRIYAHPQTRKDMEEAFKDPKMESLRAYLPNELCPQSGSKSTALTIKLGKEVIPIYHFSAAHTSGDIIVFFPTEKVAFVGDLVFIGRDPLIHRQKGGTSLGLVENLRSMLALDADQYIPGHGDIVSKNDIKTLMASIEEKQAKIRDMIREGKALDEIKKAFGIADPAAASGTRRFMSLVEVIYMDLTEKK